MSTHFFERWESTRFFNEKEFLKKFKDGLKDKYGLENILACEIALDMLEALMASEGNWQELPVFFQ